MWLVWLISSVPLPMVTLPFIVLSAGSQCYPCIQTLYIQLMLHYAVAFSPWYTVAGLYQWKMASNKVYCNWFLIFYSHIPWKWLLFSGWMGDLQDISQKRREERCVSPSRTRPPPLGSLFSSQFRFIASTAWSISINIWSVSIQEHSCWGLPKHFSDSWTPRKWPQKPTQPTCFPVQCHVIKWLPTMFFTYLHLHQQHHHVNK